MPSFSSVLAAVVGFGSLAAAVPYGSPDGFPYDPTCPATTPYMRKYPMTTSQCMTKTYTKVYPTTYYMPAGGAGAPMPTPPSGGAGHPPSFQKRYEGMNGGVQPAMIPYTTCYTKTYSQTYTKTYTYQVTKTAMAPRYCATDMPYYDACCGVQVVQQVAAPAPAPQVVRPQVVQVAAPAPAPQVQAAVPVVQQQVAAAKPVQVAPAKSSGSDDEGGDIDISNKNANANKNNNKVNATNNASTFSD